MAIKKNLTIVNSEIQHCEAVQEWLPTPPRGCNEQRYLEVFRQLRDDAVEAISKDPEILTIRDVPRKIPFITHSLLKVYKLDECPEITEELERRKSGICGSMLTRWATNPKTSPALQKLAYFILANEEHRRLIKDMTSSEEIASKTTNTTVQNNQFNFDPRVMDNMLKEIKSLGKEKQVPKQITKKQTVIQDDDDDGVIYDL